MREGTRKLTSWERAQVDVSKPAEVVGWCNKRSVTPERLKAAVAEVGTSAVSVARALGKPDRMLSTFAPACHTSRPWERSGPVCCRPRACR
jgi:hypothetical protein